MSGSAIDRILAETNIDGLDIADALARMGNSGKLYMRIIHSFVTNMPSNLADMATDALNAETLPDYAIRIHGAKGSCYGIGANKVGDLAKELEMAAKAGDLETCLNRNGTFISATQQLLRELKALEDKVDAAEGATQKTQADRPDATKLAALLAATQGFDIDQMTTLVDELASLSYASGGEVITKIKESFEAFDYQTIEETITSYL